MRVTAEGLALTFYVGMPLDLWLAVWALTDHNEERYQEAFLSLYHLETVTVEEVEVPYEAVRQLDGYEAWWIEIVAWLLDPRAACIEGCPQSQRPVM